MFPSGRPQNMQPGGQLPMVQYPGMYYSTSNPASAPSRQSNISAQADDGRDLLAESYKRMRNEMRSLQGVAKPDAPPPPSMDSSRDNVAIKMLLNNENVSLSSLLEAAMDPSSGSNKGTEDPIMKKTVLDKCEGKIAQLYRHRISGMGTFFPNVPPKGTKANSSSFLTFHHPRIEFNMTAIDAVWNCPEVNLEAGQRRRTAETAVERDSVQRDKSPALEAAEVYANKPNPSVSTHLFSNNQPEPRKPTELPPGLIPELPPGPITVIAPRRKDVPVVDLTSYTEPPPDPYATTAFELWAEIERERRHKEKLKEWEMLNEKHKQKEQEKEERKKKKKRHRHSRSRSRSRRRSRSYSRSRSRSRHRERRWRSRSRRRTRSISLSPSPSRKRSRSPRYIEQRRLSRSPERRSSRHTTSPSTLISPPKYPSDSRLQPGPPGHEWSTSSAWPQNTSNVPPTSEYYQYGNSQVHPEGSDYYYGNNRPYPPFNLPQNRYGLRPPFPLRGYPMGGHRGGPHMWGPRGPPPYGYRPPLMDLAPPPPADSTTEKSKTVIKRFYVKSTSNPNLLEVDTFPSVIQKLGKDSANKTSKQEPDVIVIPTSQIDSSQKRIDDVIVLDDDNRTDVKTVPRASSASEDHPPGVSPDRELPQTTIKMSLNKESEFTKPLRAKFRELLEPIEKILDTLRVRQRDSYEFKTLIRGLEIGSCEFDGVYTLVEGILCRVVIDAMESAKTCFKIVLSPVHVTPILMEIHKMYHDYTSSKIKSMIEDLFYDSRLFPSWKIGNVIAICKQCKSAAEARRTKRDEKQGALQRSSERDESNDVDRESRSKSKSCRRRSESTDRDDGKKGRRGSRDDRKAPRDRPEKTELHRGKKRELKDITLKGGDVLLNVVGEPSKKVKDSPKHTARGTEKVTGSADDKSELVSSKAAESKTGKTKAVEKDVVKGKSSSKLEEGKSASSKVNHSELPDAPMKKGGPAQSNPAPSVKPQEGSKMEDAHGRNGENSGSSPLKRGTELSKKPLVPYSFGNKPEDFKLRVRRVQLSVDDLKTHITRLERPDGKSADPNFLLKAGMLCKRVPTDDGKTEVKIAVTPPSLLEMIQIVHTMAATHAPLEKTITVFNKHFTPMGGVQEAVTVVLNNCEVCKSS